MPMLMIGIFDIGRGSSDDSGGFGDIGMTTMTMAWYDWYKALN